MAFPTGINFSVRLLGFIALTLFMGGCGPSEESASKSPPAKSVSTGDAKEPTGREKPAAKKPDPGQVWKDLIARAGTQLEAGDLEAAGKTLEAIGKVYADPDEPAAEQQAALDELKTRFAEKKEQSIAKQREENLAEAERLMNVGKLTEAAQKVNDVIAAAPTSEQREKTRAILAEIASRRKARRDLRTWVQLLEREDRGNIATAHSNLLRQPDVALGMMIEASENLEKPILAANSLEVLRMLGRPKEAIPAMIAVLKRPEQKDIWPAAVRELGLTNQSGAGEPLLELALSADDLDQRIAALDALSEVVDIPNSTFARLLPMLRADGPELAAALRAAYQAVRQHNQYDFAARRGFDEELTSEQADLLSRLPERLKQLVERPADDAMDAEVVHGAKVLAMATHLVAPNRSRKSPS